MAEQQSPRDTRSAAERRDDEVVQARQEATGKQAAATTADERAAAGLDPTTRPEQIRREGASELSTADEARQPRIEDLPPGAVTEALSSAAGPMSPPARADGSSVPLRPLDHHDEFAAAERRTAEDRVALALGYGGARPAPALYPPGMSGGFHTPTDKGIAYDLALLGRDQELMAEKDQRRTSATVDRDWRDRLELGDEELGEAEIRARLGPQTPPPTGSGVHDNHTGVARIAGGDRRTAVAADAALTDLRRAMEAAEAEGGGGAYVSALRNVEQGLLAIMARHA